MGCPRSYFSPVRGQLHVNKPLALSHRIEEELGDKARFAGQNFRHPIWAGLALSATFTPRIIFTLIRHARSPACLEVEQGVMLKSKVQVCGLWRREAAVQPLYNHSLVPPATPNNALALTPCWPLCFCVCVIVREIYLLLVCVVVSPVALLSIPSTVKCSTALCEAVVIVLYV